MSWSGYKTKRWRKLRESILRRDGYRCRESARYGIRAEADTVHHVWPAEDFPEYAWEPWNLISLTSAKHDAMHDRIRGRLTPLGESWRRRISPPPSGGRSEPLRDRGGELFPTAENFSEGVRAGDQIPRMGDAPANDAPG